VPVVVQWNNSINGSANKQNKMEQFFLNVPLVGR